MADFTAPCDGYVRASAAQATSVSLYYRNVATKDTETSLSTFTYNGSAGVTVQGAWAPVKKGDVICATNAAAGAAGGYPNRLFFAPCKGSVIE